MEMSFIKLCEPKLEQSNDALLDRISQLEATVKRGVPVQTAPQQVEQKAVQPAQKVQEPVQPQKVDVPPVAPQPETEPKPQSVIEPEPQPQPTAEPTPVSNQSVDFDQWAELMDILHKTDIALFGVLTGASASIVGEHFVIDSPNPTIKEFIKIPTHSKAIKQAVFELTGRNLKLAIAKKKSSNDQKRDLLEDLINQAQNNIKINFE
jgi:DNA polymerase-3 subunit gamma/tau